MINCQIYSIVPMAWSPLGGGKLFTGSDERSVKVRSALAKVGSELGGLSVDQVAYAFLLTHPSNMVVVLGTNSIERIQSAAAGAKVKLSIQQWFTILEASQGKECP